ncbi:MAG TPA: ABC transporter ATP-binding protein [Hyphomicrobiales bacterium]|nr:ABC transporter ATP-binding protein [Hyphomicrobiales bacterium]
MSAAIRFDNLTLGYDRHPAIHHLDGAVAAGALLAVAGPNGAGKSTLLKGIAGLLRPLEGRIRLEGCRAGDIAYLPQVSGIDLSFPIGVFDFVAMGLWRRVGALGRIGEKERARIAGAIGEVGLAGFEQRPIGTLSGGQMQRVLFARLALQDAPLILLDEPFQAIEEKTVSDLLSLIDGWHREGRTILAVLHDLDMVRAHFPETLILAREPVAWGPTRDILAHGEHLDRARAMMEAWDEEAAICARDAA